MIGPRQSIRGRSNISAPMPEGRSIYRRRSYDGYSTFRRMCGMGEFILGTFVAQLYINIEQRPVSERENLIGTLVFFAAVISVIVITYLNYGVTNLNDGPDAGAEPYCANVVCKMNMNFALAPTGALLVFCGARYKTVGSRILMSRPILLLGGASYSIYLVHDIVLGPPSS